MIKKILMIYSYVAVLTLLLCSCANYKEVPYFQNSQTVDLSSSKQQFDLIIQPKDELNIFVYSPLNEELAASFNKRERVGLKAGQKINNDQNQGGFYRYLVDSDGNIEFPEVGKIHVSGLTIEQTSAAVKEGYELLKNLKRYEFPLEEKAYAINFKKFAELADNQNAHVELYLWYCFSNECGDSLFRVTMQEIEEAAYHALKAEQEASTEIETPTEA